MTRNLKANFPVSLKTYFKHTYLLTKFIFFCFIYKTAISLNRCATEEV